jgi:hypothetical protein
VLDDLSSLHQTVSFAGAAWLYQPEDAIRMRAHFDAGERLPPEEPAGENRATGAFIDYVVNGSSAEPLTLSIYDSDGRLVRHYSSALRVKATDPASIPFPAFWAPAPPSLATSKGAHRFVWDLQYATLQGEPESNFLGGGPLAPPGTYTVRLTFAGRTWAQSLAVRKDPRVRAGDADLVAQFRLARQIEALRVAADEASIVARARKFAALAGGPPVSNPENSVGAPQTEFTSLWAVGNGLDQLEAAVESADAAPTSDEISALAHWRAVLAADRARL